MEKFRKSERLCSRKAIGRLFTDGNVLFNYPFKLVWLDNPGENPFPVRMALSVPRKRIRKAVNRNRIKRLVRESYRINKKKLYDSPGIGNRKIDMVLLYVSDEICDFELINLKLSELINKFIQENAPGKDIL